MKKTLVLLGLGAFVFTSCGGPDQAAYAEAADTICKCMDDKATQQAAEENEFSIDFTDLNFALCALDVATKVDPFTDDLGADINEKCPKWKAAHEAYQKAN
jgi:hypothetical protein